MMPQPPKIETENFIARIWLNEDGQIHREDGPAFETIIGIDHIRSWYLSGNFIERSWGENA